MKLLLELIAKLFGKGAVSKTIGSRTNVIKLADNDAKRLIQKELNILEAGDEAVRKGLKDAEGLIADIPKMNDQEILTFTGNLKRLDQRINPPQAEVLDITTQQKVSPEGIESLLETSGQKTPPGTMMGNIESKINKLKSTVKNMDSGTTMDDVVSDALQSQKKFKSLQDQGLVTAASREILQRDIKSGVLKLPKEIEDRIMLVDGNPGRVDPIEIFRTNYGEDALEQVDSLIPDLAKAQSYKDLLKIVDSKYTMKPRTSAFPETISPEDAAKAEDEFGITSLKNPSETYKPFGSDLNRQEKVDWLIKNVDPEAEVTIPSPGALQSMLDGGREDLIDHFWEIHTSNIGRKPVVDIDTSDLKNPELVKFMMERKARKPKLVDPEDIDDVIPDPEDPEGFAMGGRVSYAYGSGLKLIQLLKKAKKSLKQAIKESADDIIPTGDSKLDADMAVDNMLEKLGVDRDAVDGYDILDAYGEAYKTVTRPKVLQGGIGSLSDEEGMEMMNALYPEGKIKIGGQELDLSDIANDVKLMNEKGLRGNNPGDFDKFVEMQLSGELGPQQQMKTIKMELRNKYSRYLDDETMDVIQESNDPQKVAEVYANVREAALLSDRGVPTEEIVDTIIKTPRTKQADGTGPQGLANLLGV